MALDITLLAIGKTRENWLLQGLEEYERRLKHYASYRRRELPAQKEERGRSAAEQMEREGQSLLQACAKDYLILLDVRGQELDSEGFAAYLQKLERANVRKLCFAVGGAWGFSPAVYEAGAYRLSLSRMTLNHQMVRLLFTEQLYRAFSILAQEPYHHG